MLRLSNMKFSPPFRSPSRCRAALFPLLIALLAAGPLQAEIGLPDYLDGPPKKKKKKDDLVIPERLAAPPQPVPVEVSVSSGGEVEIPLRVYGRRGQRISYRLRENPRYGRIIRTVQEDVDRAMLVYQPTASGHVGEIRTDLFHFVAVGEEGSSAPAAISVRVTPLPAELVSEQRLSFGNVEAGAWSKRRLTITNVGGETALGRFSLPAPWKAEPENYRIKGGETLEVIVSLLPGEARPYQARLEAPLLPREGVALSATAYWPVEVDSPTVTLSPQGEAGKRAGTLTLSNPGQQPREVTLKAPRRVALHPSPSLTLPPGGEATMTITVDDPHALQEKLQIVIGEGTREIALEAAPESARVEIAPAKVDFGAVRQNGDYRQEITLRNTGGSAGEVKLRATPPFEVEPATLRLEPGERKTVEVTTQAPWAGQLKGEITLEAGGRPPLSAALSAEVLRPDGLPVEELVEESTAPEIVADMKIPEEMRSRLRVLESSSHIETTDGQLTAEVTKITTSTIELVWKPTVIPGQEEAPPLPVAYEVQARQWSVNPEASDPAERLKEEWHAFPEITIETQADGSGHAVITGMPAGASLTMRVAALDGGGKVERTSPFLHVSIPHKTAFFTLRRVLLAFFGLLFLATLWLRTGRSLLGLSFDTGRGGLQKDSA